MVLLTDPWLVWWLRSLRRIFQPAPQQPLYPFSAATFNARIARVLQRLTLPPRSFTAAGLRAGGTTHLMRLGVQIDWLRHRGRWASAKSMERYVQECGAVLAELNLSTPARERINRYGAVTLNVIWESQQLLMHRAERGATRFGLVSPFVNVRHAQRRSRGATGS